MDILTLKSTNIAMLRQNIAFESIFKTFQDAVLIIRNVGLRYLWIDSLCIIQDSPEDWDVEAAQMGGVYENSICAIAASAAQNAHDGCFSTRNPLTFARCHVSGSELDGKGIYTEPKGSNPIMLKSRLITRAWVLQEKKLSTRTLSLESTVDIIKDSKKLRTKVDLKGNYNKDIKE